jgi:hypothetical protein
MQIKAEEASYVREERGKIKGKASTYKQKGIK